ncbi:MAG: WD40 repeat domain-containing protein [Planctomycetota bacterium]
MIRRPAKIPGVKHWQVTTLLPYANVQCLAWHPARDWLAVGVGNGEVRIYDMEGDRFGLLHLWVGHSGSVTSLDWHSGGKTLASASEDRTIRIWDTEASSNHAEVKRRVACRVLQQHEDVVRSVDWSPDGSTLASGSSDGTVRLWEDGLAKHRILAAQQSHVWKVAWNATGDSLAVGGLDGIVRIMKRDGTEEETSWQGAKSEPHELAFDPLGRHLITCGFEPEVFVRDRTGNQSRVLFTALGSVTGAAVDRSHRKLAVVGNKLWIWANWRDDPTPREERLINQSPGAVAWSADGSRLAFGGQRAGLCEWNERTRQIKTVFLENGRVIGAAWSSDGTRLATGCGDGRLRVWSREGRLVTIKTAHTGIVGAVSWSPDGRRVATGGSWPLPGQEPDNSLRLWSVDSSDQPPVRFDSVGAAIHDLSWTADVQRVVVGTASGKPDDRLVSFNTLTG